MSAPDNPPRAIYLLNPDTITQPRRDPPALRRAARRTNVSGWSARGCSYGDGSFQHSAFAFPGLRQLWVEFFPTPGRLIEGAFNGRYPRALYERGEPFPVDFVLGATMMLRREVIEQTGMFDEQFFMYCEEIDWAWRIHEAGWQVWCVPAAQVTHLGGQSTASGAPAQRHQPVDEPPAAGEEALSGVETPAGARADRARAWRAKRTQTRRSGAARRIPDDAAAWRWESG